MARSAWPAPAPPRPSLPTFSAPTAPAAPPVAVPPPVPSIGQPVIRVTVNGVSVRFDVPPEMGPSGVYVPLRGVFEEMGATVDFQRATGQITATRGATTVQLAVGQTMARIDGETAFMLQPAVYRNGRTLVPLRFVSQALGASVDWNPVRREVEITVSEGGSARPRRRR